MLNHIELGIISTSAQPQPPRCILGSDTEQVILNVLPAVPSVTPQSVSIRCKPCEVGQSIDITSKSLDGEKDLWFCAKCPHDTYSVDPNNPNFLCQPCPLGGVCHESSEFQAKDKNSTWEIDQEFGIMRLTACPAAHQLVSGLDKEFSPIVQECRPCLPVSEYIVDQQFECRKCPVGAECENGKLLVTGSSRWEPSEDGYLRLEECDPGQILVRDHEFPPFDQCFECPQGTYQTLRPNYSSEVLVASRVEAAPILCNACVEGLRCDGGGRVAPISGYWSPDPFSYNKPRRDSAQDQGIILVYRCPPGACLEGGKCATGREGPVCGVCQEGHALFYQKCLPCGSNALSVVTFLIVFCILMLVLFYFTSSLLELQDEKSFRGLSSKTDQESTDSMPASCSAESKSTHPLTTLAQEMPSDPSPLRLGGLGPQIEESQGVSQPAKLEHDVITGKHANKPVPAEPHPVTLSNPAGQRMCGQDHQLADNRLQMLNTLHASQQDGTGDPSRDVTVGSLGLEAGSEALQEHETVQQATPEGIMPAVGQEANVTTSTTEKTGIEAPASQNEGTKQSTGGWTEDNISIAIGHLRIAVSFAQIVSSFPTNLRATWPFSLDASLLATGVIGLDWLAIPGVHCVANFQHDVILYTYLIGTLIVLFLVNLPLMRAILLRQNHQAKVAAAIRCGKSSLTFVHFLYVIIARKAIQSLVCHDLEEDSWLKSDYRVPCPIGNRKAQLHFGIAISSIIVFAIATPIGIVVVILVNNTYRIVQRKKQQAVIMAVASEYKACNRPISHLHTPAACALSQPTAHSEGEMRNTESGRTEEVRLCRNLAGGGQGGLGVFSSAGRYAEGVTDVRVTEDDERTMHRTLLSQPLQGPPRRNGQDDDEDSLPIDDLETFKTCYRQCQSLLHGLKGQARIAAWATYPHEIVLLDVDGLSKFQLQDGIHQMSLRLYRCGILSLPKVVWDGTSGKEEMQVFIKIGFLLRLYKVEVWFWDIVDIIRRLVMGGFLSFIFSSNPITQIQFAFFLSVGFLGLALVKAPFVTWSLQAIYTVSLFIETCILAFVLTMATQEEAGWGVWTSNAISLTLSISAWLVVVHPILVLIHHIFAIRNKTRLMKLSRYGIITEPQQSSLDWIAGMLRTANKSTNSDGVGSTDFGSRSRNSEV